MLEGRDPSQLLAILVAVIAVIVTLGENKLISVVSKSHFSSFNLVICGNEIL